jgi:NitT/TauT family transport system ATP-binding protein
MIDFASVSFAYPRQPPIFDSFSWSVAAGETWAVLGPSGCGKTTLLYLLAGLRTPTSGQVRVHGQALTRPHPQTGLILQDYGLLPWATVRQNAALGLAIRGFYGPDGKHAPNLQPSNPSKSPGQALQPSTFDSRLSPLMHRLGLADLTDQYPSQLSGGQRQRTAIARTLALSPTLLLMDEPFASLDAPTRESLQNLIYDLCREQNLTLVVVTHAIEEAALLGQNILLLGNPPHRAPQIIPNPAAGDPAYRDTPAYRQTCHTLRQALMPLRTGDPAMLAKASSGSHPFPNDS